MNELAIGKTSTIEIYSTQPKENDRKFTKMSTKYFSRNFLQIIGLKKISTTFICNKIILKYKIRKILIQSLWC